MKYAKKRGSKLVIPPLSPTLEKTSFRPMRKVLVLMCLISTAYITIERIFQPADGTGEAAGQSSAQSEASRKAVAGSQHVGSGSVVTVSSTQEPRIQYEALNTEQEEDDEEQNPFHSNDPRAIRISFEDAVADVKLDGWEDDWFSSALFDSKKEAPLAEPKIDFVYNWVNGSDPSFSEIRHHYELLSPLNDEKGEWIAHHSVNRYRDWDELRFSMRSLDAYAKSFINKIQILVNTVTGDAKPFDINEPRHPQRPDWMKDDQPTRDIVQVLGQEDFFEEKYKECLPTFNSLAIETQIYNTKSETDHLVALSDDMFLGMPHAASDFYSPLFGVTVAFKKDSYNVRTLGSKSDLPTFGEKPFTYYTSYLLNARFGHRSRRVQGHFCHSLARSVMKEALSSFPYATHMGTCEHFRGESDFQLYPWYASFHYMIERFREALLWSFIVSRSDPNNDGYLDWSERQNILDTIRPGFLELAQGDASKPASEAKNRERMYYEVGKSLQKAGLQAPKVNVNIQWTSLDGPQSIHKVKCQDFDVERCLGNGFASSQSDATSRSPDFFAASILNRVAVQEPKCGDCLMKFILANQPRGLEPLLPPKSKSHEREVIIKALKKYQYTVIDTDPMKFVMVKDEKQARAELIDRMIARGRNYGQYCFNDDVLTEVEEEVEDIRQVVSEVFETLWPERGRAEQERKKSS